MRRRNMFYATGLPGWMRFGYSPGWGGLPPGAQFLMTGQWPTPQMAAAWQAMQAGQPVPDAVWQPGMAGMAGAVPPFAAGPWMPDPQAQLEALKAQAEMLEAQLEQVRETIQQLDQEPSEDQ
jgi:hypothetical protein